MINRNNILLAALGGAVIGALVASLIGNGKTGQFPLSSSTGLDELSDVATDITEDELDSLPEMDKVLQQS